MYMLPEMSTHVASKDKNIEPITKRK